MTCNLVTMVTTEKLKFYKIHINIIYNIIVGTWLRLYQVYVQVYIYMEY